MMRLQVMHLPAPPDEYPFILVVDQCDVLESFPVFNAESKAQLGARAVLVFEGEVEVA